MYNYIIKTGKVVCLMARELKRLNMNLPQELVDKVDAYADKLCLQRSVAITVLLNMALEQQGSLTALQDLMEAYKKEQDGTRMIEGGQEVGK